MVVVIGIRLALVVLIEVMSSIVGSSVIMKGLDGPLLVIRCLLATVTINATMAFFAIVIAQWMYFLSRRSLMMMFLLLIITTSSH